MRRLLAGMGRLLTLNVTVRRRRRPRRQSGLPAGGGECSVSGAVSMSMRTCVLASVMDSLSEMCLAHVAIKVVATWRDGALPVSTMIWMGVPS